MRTLRYRREQVRRLHMRHYLDAGSCHAEAQLGPDDVREEVFQELDPMPSNLHKTVRSANLSTGSTANLFEPKIACLRNPSLKQAVRLRFLA